MKPYETTDPLVVFLYLLLRDHLPAGKLEDVLAKTVGTSAPPYTLSNGYTAGHAADLARRLRPIEEHEDTCESCQSAAGGAR